MNKKRDVIIIGGGPAGLSASIYTLRARLNTLLIERGVVGGRAVEAELVENYPGFPAGISGYDLTELRYKISLSHYGTGGIKGGLPCYQYHSPCRNLCHTNGLAGIFLEQGLPARRRSAPDPSSCPVGW